jgi:hypothetical protein
MRMHVEAEFTHDASGRLVRVNEPNGGDAPRFFLGHTTDGIVRRYRHDVPDDIRHELEAASAPNRLGDATADAPLDAVPYATILAKLAPLAHTSVGLAYRCPVGLSPAPDTHVLSTADDAALLEPLLAAWIPDIRNSPPLVVRVLDGRAVSVCGSVRITPQAHEAGVETPAACRGHGYAAAAVATWAEAVRERGSEPLYSTSWQNAASRALARKLGLIPIGRDLHIT